MFEVLLLIAILGFLAHLDRRVKRLERQWEDVWGPRRHWEQEPVFEHASEPAPDPQPAATLAVAEPPVLTAEAPVEPEMWVPEPVLETVEPEPEPADEAPEEERAGGFGFAWSEPDSAGLSDCGFGSAVAPDDGEVPGLLVPAESSVIPSEGTEVGGADE